MTKDMELAADRLLNNDRGSEGKKGPFFIVGTQRSGTTLLRLILNSHSRVAVPEESTFLMPLLNRRYLSRPIEHRQVEVFLNYLRSNEQFRLWNYDCSRVVSELSTIDRLDLHDLVDKLFSSYSSSQGKTMWGDKTPSFFRKIPVLHALFPRARFIHIVRDGRDVFDSWRKLYPGENNVAVSALEWSYKLFQIERSFSVLPGRNRLTVRYEDLLDDPEMTVRSVTDFLGIGYEEGMLDFYRTSHRYIGDHHSRLIFRPLDKCNRQKWTKNLDPREVGVFELLARHYLAKYDYALSTRSKATDDILFAMRSLSIGLPLRMIRFLRIAFTLGEAFTHGKAMDSLRVGSMPVYGADLKTESTQSIRFSEGNEASEQSGLSKD